MKKIILAAGLVVLIVGVAVVWKFAGKETQITGAADYKNAEYLIEGQKIKLTGSTRYFGNELKTDLNNDGREDVVFLLTQEPGGSGTFFYAVAALNTEEGWVGSDGYLLGDRIAPQTTEISPNPRHRNVIVVNYADRAAGEPMTAQPSQGKSAYIKLDLERMQWGVVEPNFEGESDLIHLFSPQAGQEVSSPLEITGEARGMWFFEASFPVFLVDWDGRIIAQGIATAQSDWMTENFVPFKAKLEFVLEKDIYSNRGALILKKDNPSGLPEHDDALEIPLTFRLDGERDVAAQLRECLPKSDMASKAKCDQLLAGIRNFEECAAAGFSIMKSNPLQCQLPDGKILVQQTNSTWEMAVAAVNNCEVKKAFQTHSNIVTLELKNGNKLVAAEPKIDDIFKIVSGAEAKCGKIVLGTE